MFFAQVADRISSGNYHDTCKTVEESMIYFLGNCQADFVSRAMADKGYDTTYRVLASPMTYPSHPGNIPASLKAMDKVFGLNDYFHGRELVNQFMPVTKSDNPELIVLSLFHENTPLFVNDDEEYVFFMDPRALNDHPKLMQWAQDNCRMFQPNPTSYLDRYRDMLIRLRMEIPDVPIIVLSRLSHHPAFGPAPFSYLKGWDKLWMKGKDVLGSWESALDNVHILDMDRVFAGIWAESNAGIETHCPFLKVKLEETEGEITALNAQRDIEHIGPMPARLADKLSHFLKTESIEYGQAEEIPTQWRREWQMSQMNEDVMLQKLTSGANYQSAEAIASFFLDLGRDYTDMLIMAKDRMPVCHMTLHMIKAYSRIRPNPALTIWCDAHQAKAEQFTDNGPIYQDTYLERVEEIRQNALT